MGELLGHGVRFGNPAEVIAVGEGIETMLSLRTALPELPCIAALSANHLAALVLPEGLRHLHIACDADVAGFRADRRIEVCATATGIDVRPLMPLGNDFNDDLRRFGAAVLRAQLLGQIAPSDVCRPMNGRALAERG